MEEEDKNTTIQDKRCHVFKYGNNGKLQPLASDATDKEILNAVTETLRISNQKMGMQGHAFITRQL
jgi:hypothetical protein